MILNIQTSQAGLVGVLPTPIYINTSDTYAEVTATGYLNDAKQNGQAFSNEQMALVYTSDEGPVWLKVVVSGSDYSLVQISSPGDVTLPTIANNIIVSSDTAGTLANTTATAVNRGSIQAGLDADAGTFISYPATTASGTLRLAAVDSSTDSAVTISNADHGQATVVSIPDSGQATAEFMLSDSAGTQNITSGNFQVDAGWLASGLAAGGFAGRFDAYANTTASGILSLVAADNASGDFDTTISNATAVGQDQVISIPDAGAATGNFILSTAAATQSIDGISFSTTTGIVGTTTNDDAAAGSVGEYVSGVLLPGSAVSLTTATSADIISISLTAGDWDVSGMVNFQAGSTTTWTRTYAWASATSATLPSSALFSTITANEYNGTTVGTAGVFRSFPTPTQRFSLSGTTTIYLSCQGTFGVSTLVGYGRIIARRVR